MSEEERVVEKETVDSEKVDGKVEEKSLWDDASLDEFIQNYNKPEEKVETKTEEEEEEKTETSTETGEKDYEELEDLNLESLGLSDFETKTEEKKTEIIDEVEQLKARIRELEAEKVEEKTEKPDEPLTKAKLAEALGEVEAEKKAKINSYVSEYKKTLKSFFDTRGKGEFVRVYKLMNEDERFDKPTTGDPVVDARTNFLAAENFLLRETAKAERLKVPVAGDGTDGMLDTESTETVKSSGKKHKTVELDPAAREYANIMGFSDEQIETYLG